MPFWAVLSLEPRVRWGGLRRVSALGIGLSYCATYLLASLCLSTGIFHDSSDTPHASHHHAGAHAHDHHHETSSDPETSWADLCDFALQVLLASAWLPASESDDVRALGEAMQGLPEDEYPLQVPANLSIRSPPFRPVV